MTDILALQWLEHSNIFSGAIGNLRTKKYYTDVTLACEGKFYPVHKFVLSTCSDYFTAIFDWTPAANPVIVINNVSCVTLESLLDFMYRGEANVQECHIHAVMKAAQYLHIKGLSVSPEDSNFNKNRQKFEEFSEKPLKIDLSNTSGTGSQRTKKDNLESHISMPSLETIQSVPSVEALQSNHMSPRKLPPILSPIQPSPTSSYVSTSFAPRPNVSPSYIPHSVTHHASTLQHTKSLQKQTNYHPTAGAFKLPPISTGPVLSRTDNSVSRTDLVSSNIVHQYNYSGESTLNNTNSNPANKEASENQNTLSTSFSLDMGAATFTGANYISNPKTSNYDSTNKIMKNEPNTSSNFNVNQSDGYNVSDVTNFAGGSEKNLVMGMQPSASEIPQILESILEFKHDKLNLSTPKSDVNENVAHCEQQQVYLTSGPSKSAASSMDISKDNLYEFREDLCENPSETESIKLLKERDSPRVYSKTSGRSRSSFSQDEFEETFEEAFGLTSSSPSSMGTISPGQSTQEKESFMCGTCSKVFKKKDSLRRHSRSHTEFPYVCPSCPEKFKKYREFINHKRTHSDKPYDPKSHKCPHTGCDYSASRPSLLNSHINNKHSTEK